jgi:propionyl-CoA carboxylase alpha chain
VLSPMPGMVVSIDVQKGQEVRMGDKVAVIEAMKMENQLFAECDGTVAIIHCLPGDSVDVDQVIMEFE